MTLPPDPDWYFENVLCDAEPGAPRAGDELPIARWQRWWHHRHAALDSRLGDHCRGFAISRGLALTQVGAAEIRRRVRRGEWSAPSRGALVPVDLRDARASPQQTARRSHAVSATGALLARPGQVISVRSAAVMHGLPTLDVPDRPELTAALPLTAGRHGRALVRSAALAPGDIASWFGADLTTIARTVVDLARHDRGEGLVAADAALRERVVTTGELRRSVEQAAGWPGVRQAREIVGLADPLAESPLESLVRLRLHDDGFPAPRLQVPIGGYRVDLAWPEWRVLLEADGRVKYSGDALWREKRREHDLRRLGYVVIRVIWSDVLTGWATIREMVHLALRRASSRA